MVSPFPDGIDHAGLGRYIRANVTDANTLFYLFRCASAKNVGTWSGARSEGVAGFGSRWARTPTQGLIASTDINSSARPLGRAGEHGWSPAPPAASRRDPSAISSTASALPDPCPRTQMPSLAAGRPARWPAP